jgi:hypothetical protein
VPSSRPCFQFFIDRFRTAAWSDPTKFSTDDGGFDEDDVVVAVPLPATVFHAGPNLYAQQQREAAEAPRTQAGPGIAGSEMTSCAAEGTPMAIPSDERFRTETPRTGVDI